jgi:hypothetical protein
MPDHYFKRRQTTAGRPQPNMTRQKFSAKKRYEQGKNHDKEMEKQAI